MPNKRQRLESTSIALRARYGPQILRPASELAPALPPHLPSGFPALDAVTGCGGIPQGAITLLSGAATSGKTTLAYKSLAQYHALRNRGEVALFDISRTADPDYLHRCGIDLARLVIVRPADANQAVQLLLDLVRQKSIRLIVLDSLPDLLALAQGERLLRRALSTLYNQLRQTQCTLVVLDEANPAWLRWFNWDRSAPLRPWTALHLELRHDRWLTRRQELIGYQTEIRVLKTHWGKGGKTEVAIEFNGTVRARPTW